MPTYYAEDGDWGNRGEGVGTHEAGIQPRRGPETRSQRSRFGRSNLILKGNPASDWTHLRGSVCISSTCTPSPRVSGRCLRRRRTRRNLPRGRSSSRFEWSITESVSRSGPVTGDRVSAEFAMFVARHGPGSIVSREGSSPSDSTVNVSRLICDSCPVVFRSSSESSRGISTSFAGQSSFITCEFEL